MLIFGCFSFVIKFFTSQILYYFVFRIHTVRIHVFMLYCKIFLLLLGWDIDKVRNRFGEV